MTGDAFDKAVKNRIEYDKAKSLLNRFKVISRVVVVPEIGQNIDLYMNDRDGKGRVTEVIEQHYMDALNYSVSSLEKIIDELDEEFEKL